MRVKIDGRRECVLHVYAALTAVEYLRVQLDTHTNDENFYTYNAKYYTKNILISANELYFDDLKI